MIEYHADDEKLLKISFFPAHTIDKSKANTVVNQFTRELEEYFAGKRLDFTVPIDYSQGTEFQAKAWKALCSVGYGKTASYKDIAIQMGIPKAPRAVATSCRTNKFPLIVPCHRITSVTGEVVGYIGKGGIPKQHFLYAHEQKYLNKSS
eukprot:gene15467-18358_t